MVQLVKLGGSVLTDKRGEPAVRTDDLARLAKEIAGVDDEIVVVHGAGSFGHPLAKEFRLKHGLRREGAVEAMAEVHADVRRLDLAVLDALREAGLPAVSFAPWGLYACADGRPGGWNFVPFHRALGMGLVPVTHGDVVLDTTRGVTIASGDQLIEALASFARPSRVVFAIDQDGVFSAPPGTDGAKLLHEPDDLAVEDAMLDADTTGAPDVTGGMAGKLQAARNIRDQGIELRFVNGLVPGRLERALTAARLAEGEGTALLAGGVSA